MHRRIMLLTLAALLGTAGCTSVAPASHLSPRTAPTANSPQRSAQPAPRPLPYRESLASTGPLPSPVAKPRKAHAPAPDRDMIFVRLRETDEHPSPAVRHRHTSKAAPFRTVRPRPQQVRHAPAPARAPAREPEPRVQETYDSRAVCRNSAGVADPSVVALCHSAFGN